MVSARIDDVDSDYLICFSIIGRVLFASVSAEIDSKSFIVVCCYFEMKISTLRNRF